MSTQIPLIVFGDGPRLHSGLARIARDLTLRLVAHADEWGIRVAQVGVEHPDGLHWQTWDLYGFQPSYQDYGRSMLQTACRELQEETGERPIVLTITDPARVYDLVREELDANTQIASIDPAIPHIADLWGYFPIDANNPSGTIGGPAAAAVAACDRVLAYGRYGANVLELVPGTQNKIVPHLPHGIEPLFFTLDPPNPPDDFFAAWYGPALDRGAFILGCVATNQIRKDLGLLFAAVAELKKRGQPVALWLVTDQLTNAWDIGELATQFRFRKEEVCVTATMMPGATPLTDLQLAARYALSHATIAPGLGEGFCYPIVESLACGTPVVHGSYGGGAELVPNERWLFDAVAWRLESVYALERPVYHPADVAEALLATRGTPRAYCAGAVAHLSWEHLWPRWAEWLQQGLDYRQLGLDYRRTEAKLP